MSERRYTVNSWYRGSENVQFYEVVGPNGFIASFWDYGIDKGAHGCIAANVLCERLNVEVGTTPPATDPTSKP